MKKKYHWPQLEKHLSKRTNELFDLEDKILLYNLTNTYFEGRMLSSKIAKYGRSKEKRSDARIVVLAAVVNSEGFLKYANIFEGSMADCKTLEVMIETLSNQTSDTDRKPIVVMDAGIATNENVEMLKQKGYDYVCVTTNVENIKDETISVHQCTEPSKQVNRIYDLMNYKHYPFTRRKSKIVHINNN